MNPITKAALGLLALPAAGIAFAAPASAHGTTQHTVALSGNAHIVDYDIGADDVCDPTFSDNDTAQLPVDPQANLKIVRECDEARLTIVASGSLASTGVVTISGSVLLEDRDCFLVCGYGQVGTTPFFGTIQPGDSLRVSGSINQSQSAATWHLTFANSY